MFIYELDKASELLDKYKRSIVKEDLYFDEWMGGEYEPLVPKIIAQLIRAARFMEYIFEAIENDAYSNNTRVMGEEYLYSEQVVRDEPFGEYESVFDDITRTLALHLIEQKNLIGVDRYELRRGIWTDENYYELVALNRVMDTMCLLCDKVFDAYYYKIGPFEDAVRKREDELVYYPWETEENDYHWEDAEDPYAGDDIGDIRPPLWVKTFK